MEQLLAPGIGLPDPRLEILPVHFMAQDAAQTVLMVELTTRLSSRCSDRCRPCASITPPLSRKHLAPDARRSRMVFCRKLRRVRTAPPVFHSDDVHPPAGWKRIIPGWGPSEQCRERRSPPAVVLGEELEQVVVAAPRKTVYQSDGHGVGAADGL